MSPLFDPPFLGEPLCICPLHAVFVVPPLLSLGPSLHQLVSSVGEGWVVSLFLVLTSPRLPFLSRAKLRHLRLKAFQDLTSVVLPSFLLLLLAQARCFFLGGPQFWLHIKIMGTPAGDLAKSQPELGLAKPYT